MNQLRITPIRNRRVDRFLRSLYRWTCMTANGDDVGGDADVIDSAVVFYNDLPLRAILKDRRKEIVDDLQEDVIEELKSSILNNDEYETINSQLTLEEKIEKLLDILDTKSSRDVAQFINSLREWYKWLYDMFNPLPQEVASEETQVPPVVSPRDILEERLTIGGVPPPPPYNVKRTKLLQQVRNELKQMKGNSFLVLYGMTGTGKSTLAAEALRDPTIVMDLFEGNVIWLTVGDADTVGRVSGQETTVDTMMLLHNLNYRLADERIGEDLSSSPELALVQLKNQYLNSSKKNCLIVLDEVQNPKVLEQLNVGVRYLVTTNDLNIINETIKSITKKVKVDDSFNEEESIQLFAKCLDVSKTEIFQKEAKLIHHRFRGFPLDMSLITSGLAEFREEALVRKDRWNYYLERPKDLGSDHAIGLAIDDLDVDQKRYFRYFALFMDDVNIRPEVLSVVWGVQVIEAENIMHQFMKKCLVQRVWKLEQKSYVYGVHELILHYMQKTISQEDLKDLHNTLVRSYMDKANGEPHKLPEDNYILFFIGYHLENAGLYDMFQPFYYNLAFLEKKIKLADTYDLLRDLNKYKKYIVKDGDPEDEFSSLYEFVENCRHWVVKGIDIAQLAVQESSSRPFVYKKGVKLANKRFLGGQRYVRFPLASVPAECARRLVEFKHEMKVTAVEFVNSTNYILIGFDSGEISYHDLFKNRMKAKCVGHKAAVTHLRVSQDGTYFVSTSKDGRVLKWGLKNLITRTDRSPPPSEFQQNHESMFTMPKPCQENEPTEELARYQEQCTWVCLHQPNDMNFMAVITERQYTDLTVVRVFCNGRAMYNEEIQGIKFCEFFAGPEGVVAAAGDRGVWILNENSVTVKFPCLYPVIGLQVCPDNVIVVGEKKIVAYDSLEARRSSEGVSQPRNLSWQSSDTIKCSHYSSNYRVFGTETNSVVVYNGDTEEEIHRYGGEKKAALTQVKTWGNAVLAVYEDNTIDTYIVSKNSSSTLCALVWPENSREPLTVRCDRADRVAAYRGTELMFYWDHPSTVATVSKQSNSKRFAFCDRSLKTYLVYRLPEIRKTGRKEMHFDLTELPCRLLCHSVVGSDSKHVVMAFRKNQSAQVWHEENEAIQTLDGTEDLITADFDRYNNLFIVTRNEVQVWALVDCSFELRARNKRIINQVAILGSKAYLVLMKDRQTVLAKIIHETADLIQVANLSIVGVEDCCFSPNAKRLALLSQQGITEYNIEMKKFKSFTWPNGARWKSAAVSNSGHICVVMTDRQILMYAPEEAWVNDDADSVRRPGLARTCLSATHVVASPTGLALFAVTDRTGNVHYLEFQRTKFDDF